MGAPHRHTVVGAPVVTTRHGHNQGWVNSKDIRETELYQENYPHERVFEGGSLAGMPLDSLNRPLGSIVSTGPAYVQSAQVISQPSQYVTSSVSPTIVTQIP